MRKLRFVRRPCQSFVRSMVFRLPEKTAVNALNPCLDGATILATYVRSLASGTHTDHKPNPPVPSPAPLL